MQNVVVFDLDETLLSNDSVKTWLVIQLKTNIFRFLGALLIAPIALLLLNFNKYKSLGASLFLWFATYGLTENELKENFRLFTIKIKENKIPHLYWFSEGISELETHLIEGRHVVIATAAPEILTILLFESIHIPVHIVGTPLKQSFGGWIGTQRCWHNEKVRRLKLLGISQPWFATYSDNAKDDYPILINANKQLKLDIQLHHITHLNWYKSL